MKRLATFILWALLYLLCSWRFSCCLRSFFLFPGIRWRKRDAIFSCWKTLICLNRYHDSSIRGIYVMDVDAGPFRLCFFLPLSFFPSISLFLIYFEIKHAKTATELNDTMKNVLPSKFLWHIKVQFSQLILYLISKNYKHLALRGRNNRRKDKTRIWCMTTRKRISS